MAKTYSTINNEGIITLASEVFKKVDAKIASSSSTTLASANENVNSLITTTIDADSTDTQIPSAAAVFNALKTLNTTSFSTETVVGSIDSVASPDSSTMYFQKDSEEDTTWTMYIRVGEDWVSIGTTEVDLSNVWTKDDVAAMRDAILDSTAGKAAVETLIDYANLLKKDDADAVKELIGYDTLATKTDIADLATKEEITDVLKKDDTLKGYLVTLLEDVFVKDENITTVSEDEIKSDVETASSAE